MKKLLLFTFIITTTFSFSQTQIGSDIDGETSGDSSGVSVSLNNNGNILAIGAPSNNGNGSNSGHVRIYENIGGVWTQIGSDIDGEAPEDRSGIFVSLNGNGNIIAIGAHTNDGNGSNSGHVRIYENIGGVWTQIGSDIDGEAPDDLSGVSVSLNNNGNIIAIGASFNNNSVFNSGHVRIYENIGGVWMQIGSDIDGENFGDNSGSRVSLNNNGNIVAISALNNDSNGELSGHVRIYENIGGVWTQIGSDIDGEANNDLFGSSISLNNNGNIVAIGARIHSVFGTGSGYVRIYENIGGIWTQIGSDIDGEAEGDQFGYSISLSRDGNILVVGARGNDQNGIGSGHVRIYENIGGIWTQIGFDIDGEAEFDSSGHSISLSEDGSIVAISAPSNGGNGSNSGHVRIYDLSTVLSTNSFTLSKFKIYPNPTNTQFSIQLKEEIQLEKVSIYNQLGQLVSSSTEITINVNNLSEGIYFVEITTDKGTSTKKLIID
jgi:Flp pilus assembly pilin Flp